LNDFITKAIIVIGRPLSSNKNILSHMVVLLNTSLIILLPTICPDLPDITEVMVSVGPIL